MLGGEKQVAHAHVASSSRNGLRIESIRAEVLGKGHVFRHRDSPLQLKKFGKRFAVPWPFSL